MWNYLRRKTEVITVLVIFITASIVVNPFQSICAPVSFYFIIFYVSLYCLSSTVICFSLHTLIEIFNPRYVVYKPTHYYYYL